VFPGHSNVQEKFVLPDNERIHLERSDSITPDILQKYTEDPNKHNVQFVICGSPQMEKQIVGYLHRLYNVQEQGRIFAFSLPPQQIVTPPEVPETSTLTLPKQPQPGECCGQSCPNCIWMEYVDELKTLVNKGLLDKSRLTSLVNELDVTPSVKAFLKMEIKS
jgi:hypothetical protein